MSARLSCPSCNSAFVLGALPESRRATCPRCGDVFPVTSYTEQPDDAPPEPPPPAKAFHPPRKRWPLVAGALALIAIVIGGAVLYKRDVPRSDPPPPVTPSDNATAPTQLTGIGYLPAECNVVFAVQPGPVLAYASRTNQEPRELLANTGLPPRGLSAFDEIGLPFSQIDHIAAGAFVGNDGDELRITLALVLKQPFADESEFLKKLKAKTALGKRPRLAVELAKFPLTLARVSPTVWVFGLSDKDFAAVDTGGFGPGGAQFPRSKDVDGEGRLGNMRGMIDSVPPEAAIWVALNDDRGWTQKPVVKLAAQSPEAKKGLLAAGDFRGGMFALSFGEQPRLELLIRSADTATAERMRAYFRARATEIPSAQSGYCGAAYARLDAPFTPALIQRLLADAAK